MTRDDVLAQMEQDFALMDEATRNEVLFNAEGTDWTPTLLITAVRDNTDFGKQYVERWSQNQEAQESQLRDLILQLLTGAEGEMTCGEPDCPNCHGEVRPFGDEPTRH